MNEHDRREKHEGHHVEPESDNSLATERVSDLAREFISVSTLLNQLVTDFNDLGSFESAGSVPFDRLYDSAAIVTMLEKAMRIFGTDFTEFLELVGEVWDKDSAKFAEFKALIRSRGNP